MNAALLFTVAHAQLKEGTIVYERKINMHRNIQDEQMKAMIPEFNTDKFILLFSDSVSVYKLQPKDEMPDPFDNGGGGRVVIRINGADGGETFRNYTAYRAVSSQELGAKNYIIEDSIRPLKWKLTDETKKIMGHTCHKATAKQIVMTGGGMRIMTNTNGNTTVDSSKAGNGMQKKEVEVIAWYADDITVPAGPSAYCSLPGAILEINVDNGATIFTAAEIKNEVNKKELKEPTKGKKVTPDEFRKMQMELMQNNMQQMGGGMRTFRMGS